MTEGELGFILVDADGAVVATNAAAARALQLPAPEAVAEVSIPAESIPRQKGTGSPVGAGVSVTADPGEAPVQVTVADSTLTWYRDRRILLRPTPDSRLTVLTAGDSAHEQRADAPTRGSVVDLLESLLRSAVRDSPTAVFLLDLDHFKTVNEASGHIAGDTLLVDVGQRLQSLIRPSDVLARLGGDEFILICRDTSPADTEHIATRLRTAFDAPFEVGGRRVYTSASIGIAITPPLFADAETLLAHADAAMYEAKALGRARHRASGGASIRRSRERLEVGSEFREALAREDVQLHYQPVVGLRHGRLVGIDAVMLWSHSTRGPIAADVLSALADDMGFAAEVDQWLLRELGRHVAGLRARGALSLEHKAFLDISPRSLRDPDFPHLLQDISAAHRLPLTSLELRLSGPGVGTSELTDALQGLEALGVGVTLSAVGTGRTALTSVRQPAVTSLSIDSVFVDEITQAPKDLAIAASMIRMAEEAGLLSIAQGVASAEQLRLLRRLGCTAGEGPLWGTPQPADEFAAMLKAGLPAPERSFTAGAQGAAGRAVGHVTNEHGLHRLLRLAGDGASATTIAAALNAEGYQTPARLRWHGSSVAKVLREHQQPEPGEAAAPEDA